MEEYECTNCQEIIITCFMKCCICSEIDLCLQCFTYGAEPGDHKREHSCDLVDNAHYTIFENNLGDWRSKEEEGLLEAIENHGFSNWDDVADFVKTKTASECREHYFSYYIHGNVGKATIPTEPRIVKVVDHTLPDEGPLSPPLPSSDLTPIEQSELGYMPLRDDFEKEYDNEAETLISALNLNYDDEDIDIAFKLACTDMYRYRLNERKRRKRIAREYNLIQAATSPSPKRVLNNKKKLSKEEKAIEDKMRVFAQFHSAKDHDQFFESLHKEKQLKCRLKELMRFRRNGIQQTADVELYETEKLRRDKRKDITFKKKPNTTPKRNSTTSKKTDEKEDENREDIISSGGDKGDTNSKTVVRIPCIDLLSDTEKRLCNSIGMKPASYVTIKTCMIRDYLQRRQGIPVKFRYPSHLDKKHRRKIMNFFNENGWIGGIGVYAN